MAQHNCFAVKVLTESIFHKLYEQYNIHVDATAHPSTPYDSEIHICIQFSFVYYNITI